LGLKLAGFFRELRHGSPDGPSIVEVRGKLAEPLRPLVAGYLRGGGVLSTTGTFTDDYYDPARRRVAPLELRTDGVWVWSGDLPYYVETYGCAPPDALIDHIRAQAYRAPTPTHAELVTLAGEFIRSVQERRPT
jgi:hypothetical protein